MPITCPGPDTIRSLVRGELDPSSVIEIKFHLDECPACRRIYDSVRPRPESPGEIAAAEKERPEKLLTTFKAQLEDKSSRDSIVAGAVAAGLALLGALILIYADFGELEGVYVNPGTSTTRGAALTTSTETPAETETAQPERRFQDLATAIEEAASGSVIRLSLSGEIPIEPIHLEGKTLTIRAAGKSRPVLVPIVVDVPVITSRSPLVLEGVTFRLPATAGEAAPAIEAHGGPLFLSNCRFERRSVRRADPGDDAETETGEAKGDPHVKTTPPPLRPFISLKGPATLQAVNVEAYGSGATLVRVEAVNAKSPRMTFENGLFVGHAVMAIPGRAEPGLALKASRSFFSCATLIDPAKPADLAFVDLAVTRTLLDLSIDPRVSENPDYLFHGNLYRRDAEAAPLDLSSEEDSAQTIHDFRPALETTPETSLGHIGAAQILSFDVEAVIEETPPEEESGLPGEASPPVETPPGSPDSGPRFGPDSQWVGPGDAMARFRRTAEAQTWLEDADAACCEWGEHPAP